jgi:hypothetical protein
MVMGYVPEHRDDLRRGAYRRHAQCAYHLPIQGAMALSDPASKRPRFVARATILRRVTLPLLLPSIVISGAINFTSALESLSIRWFSVNPRAPC